MVKDIDTIQWALELAEKHGLQTEVTYSAFKHKSEFPNASLKNCFEFGLDEWDL